MRPERTDRVLGLRAVVLRMAAGLMIAIPAVWPQAGWPREDDTRSAAQLSAPPSGDDAEGGPAQENSFAAPGGQPTPRPAGSSATMDKLFPIVTPTPDANELAREIAEKIHDLGANASQRQEAIERLTAIGRPAVPDLRRALRDDYEFTRVGALAALAYIRAPESVPDIAGRLSDVSPTVRAEAAKTLGRMRLRTAVPALAGALTDHDPRVGREAAAALARIHSDSARSVLIRASADGSPALRQAVLPALSGFSGPVVVAALLDAADSPDPKIRVLAVRALGESGDPAAKPRLRALSVDANPMVREEAKGALNKIK